MNLRFWGGWFLAIACVCIFLTMGCGDGALGVKDSLVTGRVLDKSNRMPIANAIVRMASKETVGTGDLQQGNNFLNTTTNEDGYFVFEKVSPDNVIFSFEAAGYKKAIFPSTESDEESGEAFDIESVSIKSGETIDVADILLEKVSETLPSKVNVKLEFVAVQNAETHSTEKVDDNEYFSVSLNGVSYTMKAKAWRETGAEDVIGATEIAVSVRNEAEPVVYESQTLTIDGRSNVYQVIEVKPVTYSLTFQFLNVPQYFEDPTVRPTMTFLVEDVSDPTCPAKHIEYLKVSDFSQLAVMNVPAVKNPQRVLIRMNGYSDEVIDLGDSLYKGDRGSYRIDIDFDSDVQFSSSDGRVGLKDNILRRNVVFSMIGLNSLCKATLSTNLPSGSITWSRPVSANFADGGWASSDGEVRAVINNVTAGFGLSYTITVFDTSDNSSYLVNSETPVYIPLPTSDGEATMITVDASKK